MSPKVTQRFWDNVIKRAPWECWGWRGAVASSPDRAVMSVNNKNIPAARISMKIHGIKLPSKLFACHWCNNSLCTNPRHLYAATSLENMRYAGFCGRVKGQEKTHCKHGHPLSGDNLVITNIGRRKCKTCDRKKKQAWDKRNYAVRKSREHERARGIR